MISEPKIYQRFLIALMAISFLTNCTKSQDPELSESERETTYLISQFDNKTGEITTASDVTTQTSDNDEFKAWTEQKLVDIDAVSIPGTPTAMFEGLKIYGEPATTYQVKIEINDKEITLYKIVDENQTINAIEKGIAKLTDQNLQIPVLKYNIDDHGILVTVKDSYGEDTNKLRLQKTSWEQSTHVKLNLQAKKRQLSNPLLTNVEDQETTFLKDKINNKVMTAKNLRQKLNVSIAIPEEQKITTSIKGKTLSIFEIVSYDQLTINEKKQLNGQAEQNFIVACGDEIKVQLTEKEASNCYLRMRYAVGLKFVAARRTVVENESNIGFEEVDPKDTTIIQISKNTVPTLINSELILDERYTVKVEDIQGEFLMRRTLNDSANAFPFTFPGAQGRLEIVEFITEENRVVVKKADPLLDQQASENIDEEEIMAFRASYFHLNYFDSNGNPLTTPQKVRAQFDEPGAYVEINWTSNKIPDVLSPLAYHYVGQCFSSQGGEKVVDMKQELKKGTLNFSIEGSYVVANSMRGCASRFLTSDYSLSQLEQRTFTFKERISFRKYDGANDDNIILDLPFSAQRKFNFGVFTSTRLKPNENGNIGIDGTEIALPNLFDFKDGKTVTYTLAGLPKNNPELAKAITKSTQTVIDNWNKSLSQAFQGSNLESKRAFIKLEVASEDDNVHLGDLDKNFIYYVEKQTGRGVLGIGGPSPNPRSGVIEASDIIIYGGNLISSLEYVRQRMEAKEYYESKMTYTPAPEQPAPTPEPETKVVTAGAASSELSSMIMEGTNLTSVNFDKIQFPASKEVVKELTDQSDKILLARRPNPTNLIGIAEPKESMADKNPVFLSKLGQAFQASLSEISQQKAFTSQQQMSAIANKHLAKAYSGQLSPKQRQQLEFTALKEEFVDQVIQSINSGHQVVDTIDLDAISGSGAFDKNQSEMDFFIAKYEAVLVHEMGHALGLTHNFEGSYDKENFLFSHEDHEHHEERTASSVMDYLPMDIWEDNAPGPYDVHAIRAAYTGRLEIHEELQKRAQPIEGGNAELDLGNGQKLTLNSGKYINITDVKKLAGLDSWLDLNVQTANIIPLKNYRYCPDVEVYRLPTCNRFDHGGTAEEIVDNLIADHQASYQIRNLPNNRVRFDWWNAGGYIGRLFSTFQGIRHFMDETIYRVVTVGVDDETMSHALAAVKGMQFLHSVVRTPEAVSNNPDQRFVQIEQQDGSKVTVETKRTTDLLQGGQGRLAVRGVEYDKAIAILMLTVREIGVPDYSRTGLRMSYPDFERIFFGNQVSSPLQLPTVSLLTEVLMDNISPMAWTKVGAVNLGSDPSFKVNSTELIRSIGVQSSILNLEVNALEESNNFASLFRFGSQVGNRVPKGIDVITKLGTKLNSPTEIKYWANDGAEASQLMAGHLKGLSYLIDKETQLSELLSVHIKETHGLKDAPEKEEGGEETKPSAQKSINAILKKAPEAIGTKDLAQIDGYVAYLMDLAGQIMQISQGDQNLIQMIAEQQIKPMTDYYAKNLPVFAVTHAALANLNSDNQLLNFTLQQMVSQPQLRMEYGSVFGNVQLLNQLFYLVRPEYKN